MEPEIIFQRYAVPCAFNLHHSGKLTKEEYQELVDSTIKGRALQRSFLEEKFPIAIKRMREFAPNQNIWNKELISNYFRKGHNSFIEKEPAPEKFKDLCKVQEAEVIDFEDNKLVVKYNESTRKVNGVFVPDVKIGDKVAIHWWYVIEKL